MKIANVVFTVECIGIGENEALAELNALLRIKKDLKTSGQWFDVRKTEIVNVRND